jgi:hypothetical protein
VPRVREEGASGGFGRVEEAGRVSQITRVFMPPDASVVGISRAEFRLP